MILIHTLVDSSGTRTESFDDGAMVYTEGVGDTTSYYRRMHIVYPGPTHIVYPATGITDATLMPYGPYEWIQYRHSDVPEPELPPGARSI